MRKSMKFWHARFGPSVPQELVDNALKYSEANDFTKELEKMYPKNVFLRSGLNYIDVESKTAFHFGAVRKLLIDAWEISASGPSIDP